MRYWDSSALVPLLVDESATAHRLALLDQDRRITTWWTSRVECASALRRLDREDRLSSGRREDGWRNLRRLASTWREVEPSDRLRDRAVRLLGVHPLRAADALQLAAAFVACDQNPAALDFVCGDARLSEAARREGFRVW